MEFSTEPFDDLFEVFEELGKGHFATVKRCVRRSDGATFAAKLLRKRRVCRGVAVEDIRREALALSRLKHPNIITLHDVYDTGQSVVLLLELVTGGELFHYVGDEGHLEERRAVHIVRQILDAVQHMHQIHLAHLDLKPENVLVVERCELPHIKVIDLGLSQWLDEATDVKTVFGTPEFVAPEVVNFDTLSLATDMWSVGVITYILLSGASPFLGETKQETYSNVANGTFSFDKEYFEFISDDAKDFICRLLVKDPRGRDSVWDSLQHSWIKKNSTETPTNPHSDNIEAGAPAPPLSSCRSPMSLLEAVGSGDIVAVESQLAVATDERRLSAALGLAAETGHVAMVRLLINAGASLGPMPMMTSELGGESGVMTSEVEGEKGVMTSELGGETPLMRAARAGHADVVNVLIEAGACLSTQNKDGDTALHLAAAWGRLECACALVETGGASSDWLNAALATPLHLALANRQSTLACYLLNTAGADYELEDGMGERALHLACREGLQDVVEMLCLTLMCATDVANRHGLFPLHIAARHGHTDIVRILCLAGCNTEQKNADGIRAEITAIKHGHNDISQLLTKVKNVGARESYIKQLSGDRQKDALPRINIQLFGHSGVGKTTLVESLKAGYFTSFFRRHPTVLSRSTPNSPNKMQMEMDYTSRQNSLDFELYNYHYTRGVDVQQVSLGGSVGDVTMWDFSGQDTYFGVYHHLVAPPPSLLILVVNLSDPPSTQFRQAHFWLSFLQARIPPSEPLGPCGRTANTAHVVVIGSHADTARASRNAHGEYHSLQVTPHMTGLCEAVLGWVAGVRKASAAFPVVSYSAFADMVRAHVNPLAHRQHLAYLVTQLMHMGELVVLQPAWLCGEVLGQLLSIEFIARARITGCYSAHDFQAAFPPLRCDAAAMLQLLETMHLCVQCEVDGEIEFEFPCYNLVETDEMLWEEGVLGEGACYGGVRLHSPPGTLHLLHSIFTCVQVELRSCDAESDLFQWLRGSKLVSGLLEAMVTLEQVNGVDCIEVKVLLEMSPGLSVEKHVLSCLDLRNHSVPPYAFPPPALMHALLSPSRLDSRLHNPLANTTETLRQLIAFDDPEVERVVVLADELSVGVLSSVCRQSLSALLDPTDALGKDWCLLALNLNLGEHLPALEQQAECRSPTAAMLDAMAADAGRLYSVGSVISKLEELGREDAAEVLLRSAPLYRVCQDSLAERAPSLEESGQNTPSASSSRNVSR
ncbi:hypothetical protein LSTR_LSTR005718 [Laodelphax striatellus]|uniref:Uncharacterized protein n=1 Tax=Laodelphax striatellus TaxID=195883 RepID=A0A482XHW8_LAOST|nr:hypothetical protein LSTR_LSTR005718 [Laodelphax striatellus]